ncbi:hypothetical protein EJB05_25878, partial [Eragrostis curvula]
MKRSSGFWKRRPTIFLAYGPGSVAWAGNLKPYLFGWASRPCQPGLRYRWRLRRGFLTPTAPPSALRPRSAPVSRMALLRSAARARQLLHPLEQQGSVLRRIPGPRLLSSSVPTEGIRLGSVDLRKLSALRINVIASYGLLTLGLGPLALTLGGTNSLNHRLTDTVERKRHANGKNDDILQRISMKIDKVSDNLDEHSRLLEELEARIKANNKRREIDLTPAVVLISASFISFGLYKYVLG